MTKKHKKSPAFQFYPSNFLGSPKVRAMDAAEVGVYWLLCCIEWEADGFTIEDAQECAESVRVTPKQFAAMWVKLSRCFGERDGRFFSPRLDKERDKQKAWRRKSSKGGKLGMKKRWEKKDKGGYPMVTPPDNTLSLSPTPSLLQKQKHSVRVNPSADPVFVEAWAEYPKRPGNSKADSYRQWLARVGEGVDPLAMLEGTRSYAKHIAANPPEHPRFIKQAQTFFGKGRHFESDWSGGESADPRIARIVALVEEDEAELARTRALLAERGAA